jgi:hypothetical protein
LVVDATAATNHRSRVLERVIRKAEARAKIIAITRRAGGLQIVVVAQAEAQAQIRFHLQPVLQVETEDLSGKSCVWVAEALVNRARKAEVHLLDSGQRLGRNYRREVGPSQPGEGRGELRCRGVAQYLA